jgi:phage terminase large subunit GpA-like protein
MSNHGGIKTFVFYGRPSLPQVWEDLDAVIFDQYKREDGVKLKVSCTAIDSGGHFTEDVYRYAKKRELNRVFAVKGASTEGKPIISRPTTSNKLKVKLFSVGTDTAKELIYSRLQMDEVSNGYMHFNMDYDEEYFKQLTAEKIQTQYNKGFAKRVWVKTRPRNEALDITVYNLAALSILNPRFKAIKEKLEPADRDDGEAKPKKKRKSSRNGGFVNGWR